MDRRAFITMVGGGMLAAPLAAEAHQPRKTPRIAIVFANAPEASLTGPIPQIPYARTFFDRNGDRAHVLCSPGNPSEAPTVAQGGDSQGRTSRILDRRPEGRVRGAPLSADRRGR